MRNEKKVKNIVVVQDENLAKLAKEVFTCRAMINSVSRKNQEKVDDIKGIIADFGGVKVQAGDLILFPVPTAGQVNFAEFNKRLIARGIDASVLEEEAKLAVNPPSVTLRISPASSSKEVQL